MATMYRYGRGRRVFRRRAAAVVSSMLARKIRGLRRARRLRYLVARGSGTTRESAAPARAASARRYSIGTPAMSALNSKSRLTAMSTQYSNPMAAKPSKRQVYGRKGRRRLDPLKKKKRSPSPKSVRRTGCRTPCSTFLLPSPSVTRRSRRASRSSWSTFWSRAGSGWQDPLVEHLGSQEMEAPPPPPTEEDACAPAPAPSPPPDLRYIEPQGTTRIGRLLCDADFSLEQLQRTCKAMYAKREHMPEHFAFCAFKGSGAADDVPYVEGVKQLEGSLSELKVAEVADVVEPHPSLEHPIAGYQLVVVPCAAPPAPAPEADVEAGRTRPPRQEASSRVGDETSAWRAHTRQLGRDDLAASREPESGFVAEPATARSRYPRTPWPFAQSVLPVPRKPRTVAFPVYLNDRRTFENPRANLG